MAVLKALWAGFTKVGLIIGNFISLIVLTIFYYTVFALFATVYKLLAKGPFEVRDTNSNWRIKEKNISNLDDLKFE